MRQNYYYCFYTAIQKGKTWLFSPFLGIVKCRTFEASGTSPPQPPPKLCSGSTERDRSDSNPSPQLDLAMTCCHCFWRHFDPFPQIFLIHLALYIMIRSCLANCSATPLDPVSPEAEFPVFRIPFKNQVLVCGQNN